jgi:RNA polymerase sigma-70 factor (ECF subfamily)
VSLSAIDAPDRGLERQEAHRRIAGALATLPDAEREALVLKELEGLKYREIAERMGTPVGTVMSRLYSARTRLARVLEGR